MICKKRNNSISSNILLHIIFYIILVQTSLNSYLNRSYPLINNDASYAIFHDLGSSTSLHYLFFTRFLIKFFTLFDIIFYIPNKFILKIYFSFLIVSETPIIYFLIKFEIHSLLM